MFERRGFVQMVNVFIDDAKRESTFRACRIIIYVKSLIENRFSSTYGRILTFYISKMINMIHESSNWYVIKIILAESPIWQSLIAKLVHICWFMCIFRILRCTIHNVINSMLELGGCTYNEASLNIFFFRNPYYFIILERVKTGDTLKSFIVFSYICIIA